MSTSIRPAFGRRSAPPQPLPSKARPERALERTESGLPIEELAQRMGLRVADADEALRAQPRQISVRWSGRAALLAGLITACLSAGGLLAQAKLGAQQSAGLDQLSSLIGFDGRDLGPALLLAGVWSAGQATFWTVVTSHLVLRRMRATSLFAYATCGAAAAIAWAGASQALGFGGPDQGYVMQACVGACAGFFYRLLAAAKPVA
jgi:hypothetical protein